jgi:hypothetical protein
VTDKGRTLANRLLELQARRLSEALRAAGPDAAEAAEAFLFGVISEGDRDAVRRLVGAGKPGTLRDRPASVVKRGA